VPSSNDTEDRRFSTSVAVAGLAQGLAIGLLVGSCVAVGSNSTLACVGPEVGASMGSTQSNVGHIAGERRGRFIALGLAESVHSSLIDIQ